MFGSNKGKYRKFTSPSQVRSAISKAKKKDDKIALRKLRPLKDYKFKKVRAVQVYY